MSSIVIAAIAWAVLLGVFGGLLTEIGPWYQNLRKPSFQPPDWLFGPAWSIILGLAAWAAVIAWNAADGEAAAQRDILIVYAANFLFHLLWSPLFFKAKRPDWALVEVIFLWSSVLAMLIVVGRESTTAGLMILPYLLWVSFASVLNGAIIRLNGRFDGR